MSELMDLYQETILDHGRHPRNFGRCEAHTHEADGFNPMCGDKLHLTLEIRDDRVVRVCFDGSGCAISTASASLMTEAMTGRSVAEFEPLFEAVHALCTGDPHHESDLGKLVVFGGVANFPMRVKCATLAWHTMKAALKGEELATTE